MARRQTFLQQIRGRTPVLLVDGGDVYFGTPGRKKPTDAARASAMRTAKTILEAYDFMGYHAVGIGPADLQFGVDELVSFLADAKFPTLCANLVKKATGEPVFRPSVTVEIAGVRYGIYSVILDSLGPSYAERVLGDDYAILDPRETTQKMVAELRPNVDVVVGLSHLNIPDNLAIAESVEGIDVIVDPYAQFGNKAIWVTEGEYVIKKGTPITRVDGQGSRVGIFEMFIDPKTKKIVDSVGYDYPLEPQIFPHPDMEKIVSATRDRPTPAGDPTEPRLRAELFLGQETCGNCHEAQYAFWKATKHATAYASLEKGDAWQRFDCIECHTTGFGVSFTDLDAVGEFKDVQCESCHGVRPSHAENPMRFRMDKVNEEACHGCHNEQLTRKPFVLSDVLSKVACPKLR